MKTLNDKLLTVVKNLEIVLNTLQVEPSRADINAANLRLSQTLGQVRAIIDEDDTDEEFIPKVPKKKTQSEPGRVTKGYHTTTIPKGKYGELSKVHEELAELVDAQTADEMLNALAATFSGAHSVFSQGCMPTIFRPGTGVFISPFASEADAFYIIRHLTHKPSAKCCARLAPMRACSLCAKLLRATLNGCAGWVAACLPTMGRLKAP